MPSSHTMAATEAATTTAAAPVTVSVLYFAASRDATGTSRETVELRGGGGATGGGGAGAAHPPPTTDTLLSLLVARHPALEAVLRSCVLALNLDYVSRGEGVPLRDGDEVAVVPPLSGG